MKPNEEWTVISVNFVLVILLALHKLHYYLHTLGDDSPLKKYINL